MKDNNRTIKFALLRKETASFIDRLVENAEAEPIFEIDSKRVSALDVREAIRTSVNYMMPVNWRIFGLKTMQPHSIMRHSLLHLSIPLEYDWSVTPWGADYTGLMIAIVCKENHFNKAIATHVAMEKSILSTYEASKLLPNEFRGVVFSRMAEERGEGVFDHLLKYSTGILVLQWDQYHLLPSNDCADILESRDVEENPGLRIAWIRIHNDVEFRRTISHLHLLGIFVSADIDRNCLRKALHTFPDPYGVTDAINDPLSFAVHAMESASAIYIPATANGRKEILMHKESSAVMEFTTSPSSSGIDIECYF